MLMLVLVLVGGSASGRPPVLALDTPAPLASSRENRAPVTIIVIMTLVVVMAVVVLIINWCILLIPSTPVLICEIFRSLITTASTSIRIIVVIIIRSSIVVARGIVHITRVRPLFFIDIPAQIVLPKNRLGLITTFIHAKIL